MLIEVSTTGEEAGSSDYPHTENNYEGFDFAVSGPYQEFPILASGEDYDGGECFLRQCMTEFQD